MYKTITNYIGETALKHIAVKCFKYQKRIMVNQQANNAYLQWVIEDETYCQWVKTADVFTMSYNIDVIGKPKDDTEILEIQNDAFQVAVETIGYIANDTDMRNILSVYDYDVQFISHFTNDSSAGVRVTLTLATPNPLDLCTFMDNFDEDNMGVLPETAIDLIQSGEAMEKPDELILKPIFL